MVAVETSIDTMAETAADMAWYRVGSHSESRECLTKLHTGEREASDVWQEVLNENGGDIDAALAIMDSKLAEWINSNAATWNIFPSAEAAGEYKDENELYGAEVIEFSVTEATGAFMETVGID